MQDAVKQAFGIAGRVSVVTGGASGIGRAAALAFAEAGADVVVIDRNAEGADETAAMIAGASGRALAIGCDVSDAESLRAARTQAEAAFGPADILANCAAVQLRGPLAELSEADWDRAFDINLKGYFLSAQIFGRGMIARGAGAMVHISSIQSLYPSPGAGAYSASKSGIVMLSRQLALEWGPHGVRSNVVQPAWVHTPFSAERYADPAFRAERESKVPLGRIGRPEDIAEAVLFLASPRASYISGTELLVDGGLNCNFAGASRFS